jgi:hypothetical protein
MSKGYFLISKGLLDHPRFKPDGAFSDLEAWLWMIQSAAFEPMDVPATNGRATVMIHLEPGQLTYSVRYLAKAWHWSNARVQRFLNSLKSDQSIDTQTDTGSSTQTDTPQTVITLCNWAKYQRPAHGTSTQTDTQTTTAATTNKKELKEKEERALSPEDGFEQWYSIFPRKKAKQDALRAFNKVLISGAITFPVLIERTKAFAAATNWDALPKEQRKYIPYPASWLNAGSYDDELEGDGRPSAPPIDPKTFTPTQWQARLKRVADGGEWLDIWGPAPGKPGCLVPSNLVLSPVARLGGAA